MSVALHPLLRVRDGHEAKVGFAELFFDLVYVFAVTQISHFLLENMTGIGAVQTSVLWFAVWLGWQYTCWMTNWFDPDKPAIRGILFALMLLALVMAAALPEAFGERGLIFAAAFAAIQVGRSLYVRWSLRGGFALAKNYNRILAWSLVSAAFWIAGGFAEGEHRLLLWAIAVACDYFAPMGGFRFPGLGKSDSSTEWTVEGGHIVERCALFMIVALGESLLVTGATLGKVEHWDVPVLSAMLVAFASTVAMWWLYFNIAVKDATHHIVASKNPGGLAAYFHYVHVIIIAGVIVSAVGSELVIAHPDGHMAWKYLITLVSGPVIFLVGNALYKRAVYGRMPLSHLAGIAMLIVTGLVAWFTSLLVYGILTTVVLLFVTAWETSWAKKSTHIRPAPLVH